MDTEQPRDVHEMEDEQQEVRRMCHDVSGIGCLSSTIYKWTIHIIFVHTVVNRCNSINSFNRYNSIDSFDLTRRVV